MRKTAKTRFRVFAVLLLVGLLLKPAGRRRFCIRPKAACRRMLRWLTPPIFVSDGIEHSLLKKPVSHFVYRFDPSRSHYFRNHNFRFRGFVHFLRLWLLTPFRYEVANRREPYARTDHNRSTAPSRHGSVYS